MASTNVYIIFVAVTHDNFKPAYFTWLILHLKPECGNINMIYVIKTLAENAVVSFSSIFKKENLRTCEILLKSCMQSSPRYPLTKRGIDE